MNTSPQRKNIRSERRHQGILSDRPEELLRAKGWRAGWAVLREAVLRLWDDEAIPLAGNIAFRAVLAIFPFLIFVSSLTAFLGDRSMAEGLNSFLIAIVPGALVDPIVSEVRAVLTVRRGDALSVGVLLTLWFAVGGVDGVRVALNRAYDVPEHRSTPVLYALQTVVVVCFVLVLVLVGYILVLAPRAGSLLHQALPGFDPDSVTFSIVRYPAAGVILMASLFAAHTVLPAGRRRFVTMWPGVVLTVIAWLALGAAFSYYLAQFANYASYYAGLAGVVAALYFLYLAALVLIFGGEINRSIRIRRLARSVARASKQKAGGGPVDREDSDASPESPKR